MTTGAKSVAAAASRFRPARWAATARVPGSLALSTTIGGASSARPSTGDAGATSRPARFFGDYEILGELARVAWASSIARAR